MQDYQKNLLDTHPYKEIIEDDLLFNCYILHVAYNLHEIIHRLVTLNEAKMEVIRNIQSQYKCHSREETKEASPGNGQLVRQRSK